MLVAVVLVAIPVNHHVHHVVNQHQVIAALATDTRRLPGVMRHHAAHHANKFADQHAVLKNAGTTIAANVIAEKFATNIATLFCKF